MPNSLQILPPERSRRISLYKAWSLATTAEKTLVGVLSASFLLGVFMFAFGQFTQIRGVQNMMASRIFLTIAWLSASLLVLGLVRAIGLVRWQLVALAVTILLLVAAVALDRIFPMPTPRASPPREAESTSPSLPFVFGAPLGDNVSPLWIMIVEHYGRDSVFNCNISFWDMDRKNIERNWRIAHNNASFNPPTIANGESQKLLHIPELDSSGMGLPSNGPRSILIGSITAS